MCSVSFVEKLWRSPWKLQWFLHSQLVHARRALSYNQPLWKRWLQQGFLIQMAVLSWLPPKASASFSQVANHSFWRAVLVFRYYKEGRREHEGKDISCFELLLLTCQLWTLCGWVQVPRMVVAVESSLKMGRDFTGKKWGCPRWGDQLSLRQEGCPGSILYLVERERWFTARVFPVILPLSIKWDFCLGILKDSVWGYTNMSALEISAQLLGSSLNNFPMQRCFLRDGRSQPSFL